MILDLSDKSIMREDVYNLLKQISLTKKDQFNSIIDNYSNVNKNKVDWWVQRPASRNTHQSFLFYKFCCIHLIDELIRSGEKIEKIICDSPALTNAVQTLIVDKKINTKVIGPRCEGNKILFYIRKSIILMLKTWQKKKIYFGLVKSTKKGSLNIKKEIILIDKFIIPGFVSKEYYYNGLFRYLNKEQKEKIYFVPTFAYMDNDAIKLALKELRTSSAKYLFKEDFLTNSDLLYGMLHLFRVWFIKTPYQKVLNIDFSPFVREELLSHSNFDSALEGLLNFRFAKKLKEKKLKIPLIIDWWEGQPVDKGWILGFKTFFPESITKGYMGYPPLESELQLYPTSCELENNVSHDVLCVIGKKFYDELSDMNLSLNIEKTPGFRFGHLWDYEKAMINSTESFKVLIALSSNEDESLIAMEKIIKASIARNRGCEFFIKNHPLLRSPNKGNLYNNEKWPKSFFEVKGLFSEFIDKIDLLISSGVSSVGLEALAIGIPVIIIETLSGLPHQPIPKSIPKELWGFCKTSDEINKSFSLFHNRTKKEIQNQIQSGDTIKNNYFEPITRKGIYKFLELKN